MNHSIDCDYCGKDQRLEGELCCKAVIDNADLRRQLTDANARIARLQAECRDWRDWQRRIAHDEGVCGFVHHHDYGLYSRIADPDVSQSDVDANNDLVETPQAPAAPEKGG